MPEEEVVSFFDRHELLQKEPEYVRAHANDTLLEYIADYGGRLEDGWLLYWYFITTGKASEKIAELCLAKDSTAKQEYANVGLRLIDISGLKELYIQSQTLEQNIPEQTKFHLRQQSWIIKSAHYRTLVAIVKGTTLAGLYRKERERIFAYNIRSYLGKNQLNKEIITTAVSVPEEFFYFNNGVSAICTDFVINEKTGEFVGKNFQIINGAQTVGALSSITRLSSSLEILLRVTEAGSVKTEKGFNADIIRYNNTQNVVKLSDFRSNDQIHLWIEERFLSLRARGAVDAKIAYQRKRSFRRMQKTYIISLEEFAKVRFAYLYEPTRCVADPKSLWTHHQDGGYYEQAFGVEGSLKDFWPDDIFGEALLMILIYKKIGEQVDQSIKRDRKFLWLRRLRYFALALSAENMRIKKVDGAQLRGSRKNFEAWFDAFWRDCLRALIDAYHIAVDNDKVTVFALARSEQRWAQVKAKYATYLELEF